jgi:hypothetical protein
MLNRDLKRAAIGVLGLGIFCLGIHAGHLYSVQSLKTYATQGQLEAEMLPYANDPLDRQLTVRSKVTDALEGGALLIGVQYSKSLACLLVDGQGRVLKRWDVEHRLFNPAIMQWWRKEIPMSEGFGIDDARLLPGGSIVFSQTLTNVNSFRGQRLALMDRDSRILWQVPGNFHHFIDIAGIPPTIYTLTAHLRNDFPYVASAQDKVSFLDDYVEIYAMDGKKLDEISIVQAFQRSPYGNWLSSFEISLPELQRVVQPDGAVLYDLLHTNSVQYLDAFNAAALPFARSGDLLLSFRGLNAIAVLRPSSRQIVWVTKGPFLHQHDAEVRDGKAYIYDNEGLGTTVDSPSRVIRYDPTTNAAFEVYSSPALHTPYLGNYDRLPDGSWIISAPQRGRVIVVTPAKQVVWELRTIPDFARVVIPHRKEISFVHYYPGSQLRWLNQH